MVGSQGFFTEQPVAAADLRTNEIIHSRIHFEQKRVVEEFLLRLSDSDWVVLRRVEQERSHFRVSDFFLDEVLAVSIFSSMLQMPLVDHFWTYLDSALIKNKKPFFGRIINSFGNLFVNFSIFFWIFISFKSLIECELTQMGFCIGLKNNRIHKYDRGSFLS